MRLIVLAFAFLSLSNAYAKDAVLILAHGSMLGHGGGHHLAAGHDHGDGPGGGHGGGHEDHSMCSPRHWNDWEHNVLGAVNEAAEQVETPVMVSFGMWETECFQKTVDHLVMMAGGKVDTLYVLPLFISSHSIVIEAQRYVFRQSYQALPSGWVLTKINFNGKIKYLDAIDYHPVISEVLADRARTLLTQAPSGRGNEIVLVMHGPMGPSANRKWIDMGEKYAADLKKSLGLPSIQVMSLQDDAFTPIRNANSRAFRKMVEGIRQRGNNAIILPLLLSEDGIQKSVVERLQGLEYVWTGEALLPDARLSDYVLERIHTLGLQ